MVIHTIFTHRTEDGTEGTLGIDDNGQLYWNNKIVQTKSRVTFGWFVNLFVIIASVSTFVMALYAVLDFYYK